MDDNGFPSFSPTVPVNVDGTPALRLYPSIATPGMHLRINTEEPADYLLRLFSANGQQVWSTHLEQQPVVPPLPAGLYYYKIEYRNGSSTATSGKLVLK